MNSTLRRSFAISMVAELLSLMFGTICCADQPFTASPLGIQRVLVIPVEHPPGPVCPNGNEECPTTQAWYDENIGPPRHSPEEWQSLLNSVAGKWWQQASYGQSQFEFTVLRDPDTEDGWWPTPHTFQDYIRNVNGANVNSAFNQMPNTPTSYAFVPDVTAAVVQAYCSDILYKPAQLIQCAKLQQYNRLIVLHNIHNFGAQSLGNDIPLTISTDTIVGNLVVSATVANEDVGDQAISPILHELGHQAGEISHYGDCSAYFSYTSFNSTLPGGPAECISSWDIMGTSYYFSDFSAYSKVSRGLVNAESTPTFDLLGTRSFAQTLLMNPIESAPTANHPNVLRLALGDPSWPAFLGYYVECRQLVGNDVAVPFPGIAVPTIPDVGVLITNVHEFSVDNPLGSVPAHHVERALSPSDTLNNATLKPGQVFADYLLGLSVRFNAYMQSPDGTNACSVSVAHNEPLPPPPRQRAISFAGSLITRDSTAAHDVGSIGSDIALNEVLKPSAKIANLRPVAAPWAGHDNPLFIRVHNRSTGVIAKVGVQVRVHQPALITDTCTMNMSMSTGSALDSKGNSSANVITGSLRDIMPGSAAVAPLDWTPVTAESVSIDAVATGPGNTIAASSRAAFQFHNSLGALRGITSVFVITLDPLCSAARSYVIAPAVAPSGWAIDVKPSVANINPGEEVRVFVHVVPPNNAAPGQLIDIPVTVLTPMQMLPNVANIDPATPAVFFPGVHYMPVGAFTVLAKVTSGPGKVYIACVLPRHEERTRRYGDHGRREGSYCECADDTVHIAGVAQPAAPHSSVTVEYRSPNGQAISHVVYTDERGEFRDSIGDEEPGTSTQRYGDWVVQARWSGGAANDPTESDAVTFHVHDDHAYDP